MLNADRAHLEKALSEDQDALAGIVCMSLYEHNIPDQTNIAFCMAANFKWTNWSFRPETAKAYSARDLRPLAKAYDHSTLVKEALGLGFIDQAIRCAQALRAALRIEIV